MKRSLFIAPLALLLAASAARAQSGHATWNGCVAFDGLAYADKQPTATIEFRDPKHPDTVLAKATTSEHGIYKFDAAPLGEVILRISAPGYANWEAPVYIPSDFNGNLAVLLKKTEKK